MIEELKRDIVIWDVKTWYKAIAFWDKNINWNKVQNCLELGGREGGLSLWLALKGINTICSDLQDVKQSAEQLHLKYKINSLIKYQDIDATNIPYDNFFDIIVFKSVIGGVGRHDEIQQQQKAFHQIYKALKPGGKLLFAENLIASPFHQKMREKYVNWGSSWRYVTVAEMEMFLKQFSSYTIKTTGVLATFGRNENQRQMFATIDELFLNKICPKEWQYICYGIAEK